MARYLQKTGHKVQVLAPNDFPEFLKWMPGAREVKLYEQAPEAGHQLLQQAELIFTLDFNSLNRTGEMERALKEAPGHFVLIDHHPEPGDYAEICYSDVGVSSTCEMVYHTIEALGGLPQIDGALASCLYAGIMTDTGSFKFASTRPRTLRVAADLMERGADHAEIHRLVYDTNRPQRLQLLGRALGNLRILPALRTAFITLSQDELDACDFQKGDTEGFVNYGLSLDGVVLAAIFIENRAEGIIKISLRSQGSFDVNAMARAHFEGGGHRNAAGGRSTQSLDETVRRFEAVLPSYTNELLKA
jgi:phosphoesterase RecJ-like protein